MRSFKGSLPHYLEMWPTGDRALVLVEWVLASSVETGLEWETLESFPCSLCPLSVQSSPLQPESLIKPADEQLPNRLGLMLTGWRKTREMKTIYCVCNCTVCIVIGSDLNHSQTETTPTHQQRSDYIDFETGMNRNENTFCFYNN